MTYWCVLFHHSSRVRAGWHVTDQERETIQISVYLVWSIYKFVKHICVLFGVLLTSPNNCSRARLTCYTCIKEFIHIYSKTTCIYISKQLYYMYVEVPTWHRGMSEGRAFVTPDTHSVGTLRGEKSVITPPIWLSFTKGGRTSLAWPISKWKEMPSSLHSYQTKQQMDDNFLYMYNIIC